MKETAVARFEVHVSKDYLTFCSGHFITYDGSLCETLHGHNYRASIRLGGDIDANYYVYNFVTIKRMMKQICDELDHRMLLPDQNPLITLEEQASNIVARYKDRVYSFPLSDVVLLPIPNTTAEMLARHLCSRARAWLAETGDASHLVSIEIEVEESPGQSAIYRESLIDATAD
jgi:6-pyruvoyltetrahydropterin/6-carboxytetrahydropterin synthase